MLESNRRYPAFINEVGLCWLTFPTRQCSQENFKKFFNFLFFDLLRILHPCFRIDLTFSIKINSILIAIVV